MVICPDCGKEVPENKFCKNCGAYLPKVENVTLPVETPNNEVVAVKEAPVDKMNYCHQCGLKLMDDFRFCPNCGLNLKKPVKTTEKTLSSISDKSMALAIILSVLLPGLGQIYLGLDNKGAILLIAYVVSSILILLLIGFILVIIIWIWALIDTIRSFNALNRGEEVEDKLF